jgi:hypothetical protein
MSTTLFRLGLWIVLIVVVLYVIHETYTTSPVAEYVSIGLLGKAVLVGAVLLVAGVVMRILEKGSKAVLKNRCSVCGAPVAHGAIYCRAHLRRVLHDEEDRTHGTRVRR